MLPYLSKYGVRRFRCLHPAHNKGLYFAPPCQSQPQFGLKASSLTSGLNHLNTDERFYELLKHRRLPFESHEAYHDPSPGEWASEATSESEVESQLHATEEAINIPSISDFASEALDVKIRDEDQDEHERQVLEALHDEDPHEMLKALAQASRHPRYFQRLRTTTLSEIIHMLQPSAFIDRERAIYQELRSDHINDLGYQIPQLETLFKSYADSLQRLVSSWKKCGKGSAFRLKEYKALLRVACAAGNGSVADSIWDELRHRAFLSVDTETVNLYMEAKCWDGAYDPGYGHTLRYINQNLRRRSWVKRGRRGYKGFAGDTLGLRTEMTKVFDNMIRQGLNPDADTFMHLMIAMGRGGDIVGVKSILKSVWAIDVDEIVGVQEVLPNRSTVLSSTSPLYPSERLLYMIAHIFGSNNDVSTALRVIDYMSYKYDVPVDLKTWQELFSWTYLLSQPRSQGPEMHKVNLRTGQLPSTALSDLWKIMRSPPYNVEPTMIMHFQRISNLRRRAFMQPMLNAMREMRNVHEAQVQRYKQCMTNQIRFMLRGPLPKLEPSAKPFFSKTQQEAALEQSADLRLERLAEYRDFICLRRALGYLLNVQRWTSRHGQTFYNVLWQRIGIHNAITEFSGYIGRYGFRYKIRTGVVYVLPKDISITVDREETAVPGIHAIVSTGVYHVTLTKYKRYGSLGNMEWDDVSFEDDEDDEDDVEDPTERYWQAPQTEQHPRHEEIQHRIPQYEKSQYDESLDNRNADKPLVLGPY